VSELCCYGNLSGSVKYINTSLIHRFTLFVVLQFALTIIHRSKRVAKNREGVGEFITSDVR